MIRPARVLALLSLALCLHVVSVSAASPDDMSRETVIEQMKPYAGPHLPNVDTSTLHDKVMCGYQDWIAPDIAWCRDAELDYLPVAFPGFSWHNLYKTRGDSAPLNQIPRLKGEFLWSQAAADCQAGAKMLYVAMFDEVDEGTAIFKCTNDPPVGASPFLTYEGLPTDHYLRLTGQIGQMLRGEIKASEELPGRSSAK